MEIGLQGRAEDVVPILLSVFSPELELGRVTLGLDISGVVEGEHMVATSCEGLDV